MYPVNGYTISNHFGVKNDRYKAGYHTGIDIKAPANTCSIGKTLQSS